MNDISLLRNTLITRFAREGLTATPQALEAMVQSALRVAPDTVGDSDAILLGLLYSGSYTIDIMVDAGAQLDTIQDLAERSVLESSAHSAQSSMDAVEAFFGPTTTSGKAVRRARGTGAAEFETADLLLSAVGVDDSINPISQELPPGFEARSGERIRTQLEIEIEHVACRFIYDAADELTRATQGPTSGPWWEPDPRTHHLLRTRRRELSSEERAQILAELHNRVWEEDAPFVVRALDHWFRERRILTEPRDDFNRFVERAQGLSYGASHFLDAGGNLARLDAAVAAAKRFSPERDCASLSLVLRDDRVYLGEYTYRNTLSVIDERGKVASPAVR
jgi:hypothetical protein